MKMYEQIWGSIRKEFSGERAKEFINRIYAHSRFNSFNKIWQTAEEIEEIMKEIGLEGVEIIGLPADGVTHYGGWVMPLAWDVEDATLEILEPPLQEPLLASYSQCPLSLMMYSAPTPPEGITAEIVWVENGDSERAYEGLDIDGKIVFSSSIGIKFAMNAFERGAIGIISDYLGIKGGLYSKGDCYLMDAIQFHNYTIPPWCYKRRGFGFAISPSKGIKLRELLRKNGKVIVKAIVKTKLYQGQIPMVTGVLPGRTSEEVVITSHLCEPGANDNASGCGMGLELARTIKSLIDKKELKPLQRGIRLLYGFEVRGYQAFLATYKTLNRFVGGINLDMVGADLSEARSVCSLVPNAPPLYSYTDFLALHLLKKLHSENPLFRYKVSKFFVNDNLFGEPFVGAPFCVLGCWPDAYYHTSKDTLENISASALHSMGTVAGTYCYILATAGFEEAIWLVQLVKGFGEEEIGEFVTIAKLKGAEEGEIIQGIEFLVKKNKVRLNSLKRLVSSPGFVPTAEELEKQKNWFAPGSFLFKSEELKRYIEEKCTELEKIGSRKIREVKRDTKYLSRMKARIKNIFPEAFELEEDYQKAKELVPLRTFKGALSLEFLKNSELEVLRDSTGLEIGWGVPDWIQLSLFLCDGKKTLWDIYQVVLLECREAKLSILVKLTEFLVKYNLLRLRPILHKEDFLKAFETLGLPEGAIVIVHSSLSRFGYVEGGADTVIDALLEKIGEKGTLVMPTLTFSWLGNPPYDPKSTPSRVGTITEVFRKRKGVYRSAHPTHSVAAMGPKAEEIVSQHTPDMPVFDKRGSFGKLYELDAYILMLAPLNTNTMMHMAEELVGLPLPDFVGHIIENGVRKVVTIKRAPWHVNFEPYYDVLFEQGLIRETDLGEEKVYLMKARDVVNVALEKLRENPLIVTVPGCECAFCKRIRESFK